MGFGLASGAGPAMAAPNLGAEWILSETTKVRQFVPAPPKLGKGKWKVSGVKDRKYFVANKVVAADQETTLDSSVVVRSEVERTAQAHEVEVVQGQPAVTIAERSQIVDSQTEARNAGRRRQTFEVDTVATVADITTATPFQEFDNVAWEERVRQTVKNTYKVTSHLKFEDPITRSRLATQVQQLAKPVEEIALGKWQRKTERRKGKAGVSVSRTSRVVATRRTERLVATSAGTGVVEATLAAAGSGSSARGDAAAYATGTQNGAAFARHTADTARLTGASAAKSAGGARVRGQTLRVREP
jgi:hypothetical protein